MTRTTTLLVLCLLATSAFAQQGGPTTFVGYQTLEQPTEVASLERVDGRVLAKLVESAVKRGQLPGVTVTGYEIRSIGEMEQAKPKKEVS